MKNIIKLIALHTLILLLTGNRSFAQAKVWNPYWKGYAPAPARVPDVPKIITSGIDHSKPASSTIYYNGENSETKSRPGSSNSDYSAADNVPAGPIKLRCHGGWYIWKTDKIADVDYDNSERYIGQWDGNVKQGAGTLWDSDRELVKDGDWKDDAFKGDSAYYVGGRNPVTHKKEGHGVKSFVCGIIYDGEWKNDMPEGHGKMLYPNKAQYEGEWVNGKMEGQGTFKYADGAKYVGNFYKNNYHGQGTLTWASGAKYVGDWQYGNRTGHGTYTWETGEKYVGEWKNSKRNGQGILYFKGDSIASKGPWVDDVDAGRGTLTLSNGKVLSGEWKNGGESGKGTITWRNGQKYEGEWKNYTMDGTGTLTTADYTYTGSFVDGLREGRGTLTYKNGEVYTGDFYLDKINGTGTLINAAGNIIHQGNWKDGTFVDPTNAGLAEFKKILESATRGFNDCKGEYLKAESTPSKWKKYKSTLGFTKPENASLLTGPNITDFKTWTMFEQTLSFNSWKEMEAFKNELESTPQLYTAYKGVEYTSQIITADKDYMLSIQVKWTGH